MQQAAVEPAPQSPEDAERLLIAISENEGQASQSLTVTSTQVVQVQNELIALLHPNGNTFESINLALSQLKERLAQTERLTTRIDEIKSSYPWPEEEALAEFAVEAIAIRDVAGELQTTINREKQLKTVQT
ncbi:MAG: hypothetical protein RLO18_10825, partial [Gimesia chilikensis]